jgi:uncharacterized protein (DUF427 family)
MWKHTGQQRPDFAVAPGPDQESVWDYPRPPALVSCDDRVEVRSGEMRIAVSSRALRVLETASPPTYYIPAQDVEWSALREIAQQSFCEWKGQASYYCLDDDPTDTAVAWLYANPSARFARIDRHVSFYPARLACFVNDERVIPQPGGFYGGWMTSRIAGPVKGEPGTGHW